jgi:2-dehydro-3-deoxyphosphogluconate aldolase / (4S)-4-hydroxy-2-oxoglutarate aldolase
MAKYSRIEVALAMRKGGIVPVFYHADREVCKEVLKACYEGGIRVFEFTNRGDFAHELFGELVSYSVKNFPGLILGAGSLVEEASTAMYIQNGANFIVSPLLNEAMARICNRRKILWSPGCGSVSEISKAEELGAEVIKIFPADEVGGPSFIKSVRGPMPWSNLMPTGGVEPERDNLMQWFKAGAWCVGMGSKLFTDAIIQDKNYSLLTSKVKEILGMISDIQTVLNLKF